jgi:hypothetical protein
MKQKNIISQKVIKMRFFMISMNNLHVIQIIQIFDVVSDFT